VSWRWCGRRCGFTKTWPTRNRDDDPHPHRADVYGTNTELEKLKLGPVAAGQTLAVEFAFRCELCPEEYTLTVASHDPDGVWHDWLEDAIAFSVCDSRYTAGVANLRARASFAVVQS